MDYHIDEIKEAFKRLDRNKDGSLSFVELHDLLVRGRPDFTEKDLRILWRGMDKDNNNSVNFDEFVDWVYGKPLKKVKEKWQDTWYSYCGSNETMEKDEFLCMCRDVGWLEEHGFDMDAAGELFDKICKKRAHGYQAVQQSDEPNGKAERSEKEGTAKRSVSSTWPIAVLAWRIDSLPSRR